MFKAIGCLVVLVAVILGGLYIKGRMDEKKKAADAEMRWTNLAPEGATRARQQITSLSRAGRAFVAVTPSDFAAHVVATAASTLPSVATGVQAAAEGDRLLLRANVNIRELSQGTVLAPMVGMLKDTEELRMSGTLHVVKPGLAEFRILSASIGDMPILAPLIPPLIKRLSPVERPAGLSENGLPLTIPEYVQDIRISEGKILLYRRTG